MNLTCPCFGFLVLGFRECLRRYLHALPNSVSNPKASRPVTISPPTDLLPLFVWSVLLTLDAPNFLIETTPARLFPCTYAVICRTSRGRTTSSLQPYLWCTYRLGAFLQDASRPLEVVSAADPRFSSRVELSVR